MSTAQSPELKAITQALVDKGKLIEAGWVGLEAAWLSPMAGPAQRTELRAAFFAGAQHLLASIMEMMTEDREPTEDDYRRMAQIDDELRAFIQNFELHNVPTRGKA